ncbi:MAG: sensor histidine kinase [Saprospiraceae bacterium]|nr:MAG: signal transduction histidine kinase [Candidatus Parvibacillus calidus]MCC7149842.1 sensor histidine kinase [Saprospiraceae bacterium]WKZ62268.1 MAG: sensor histidine kinase [Saprospiraceae bacterium]
MTRKLIVLLPFFIWTLSLSAQHKTLVDSLYKAFHTQQDPKQKIELLYLIADEIEESGKPEDIIRYADSLELLSKAANYRKGLSQSIEIRGRYHERKGEHAEALSFFQKQLNILTSIDDKDGQAKALTNIGNMWHELAANDSAVFYHLKAMKIKEELNKPGDVAISLANIANAYSDLGAYDKAIEMLKRALILRREMGEEKRTMFTLNNLSVAYGRKGDFEHSMAYADTGIHVALKYNNKLVAGVIAGGMGYILNGLQRYKESISWCERSLDYLKEVNRESNMVFPLSNLATAYNGLGRYKEALEQNEKGWAIMQKLSLTEPLEAYQVNFADAYAGLGDYKNALHWYKLYSTRKDSLAELDNLNKMASIEARYNVEKKERELTVQKSRNYRQKVALYSLIAALLILIVLGYLFYNRYRLRKEAELANAVIREQKLGMNAVIDAQEVERKRIARDLHDGIAQELVALKLGFDAVSRRIGRLVPAEEPTLKELSSQLDSSCTELRGIAHTMLPPALSTQGLAPSLELLLRNTLQHTKVEATFNAHDLTAKVDEKTEISLYRIAQELLNNIVKHSKAVKVMMELFQSDHWLVLKVEDDGMGFDFNAARTRGTMGVMNILSRVSALGGELKVESGITGGTITLVRMPIPLH